MSDGRWTLDIVDVVDIVDLDRVDRVDSASPIVLSGCRTSMLTGKGAKPVHVVHDAQVHDVHPGPRCPLSTDRRSRQATS